MKQSLIKAVGLAVLMAGAQFATPPAAALPSGGQLACAAADCTAVRGGDDLVQEVASRGGRSFRGGSRSGGIRHYRSGGHRYGGARHVRRGGVTSPRFHRSRGHRFDHRFKGHHRFAGNRFHHRHRHRHHDRSSFSFAFFGSPFFGYPYYDLYPYAYDPYPYGYGGYSTVGLVAWSPEWLAYCASKYVSFNPRTGMYRTYSGRLRFCT